MIDAAREFVIEEGVLAIPVADPFDLLANKRAVNREKDRPHSAILERFLCEEVAQAFADPGVPPRRRMRHAKRLLESAGWPALPRSLFARLLLNAAEPATRRFLAANAPSKAEAAEVQRLATNAEESAELARMTPQVGNQVQRAGAS